MLELNNMPLRKYLTLLATRLIILGILMGFQLQNTL